MRNGILQLEILKKFKCCQNSDVTLIKYSKKIEQKICCFWIPIKKAILNHITL